MHLLDSFTCTIISTFTCWLQQLQDVKCSALQTWDHATLQHCSRVSAESKVTPQADTRHLSLVSGIYRAQTQQTQRPDAARLENNLLDWYHITSRRLLIDCKNCAKFPANLSFIDYQPTHAAMTRLGYYWHCQEPGAGGAWWRGLMRSLLAHHSALNLFCLARSWGK